jgi:hypothetical protein
LNQIQAEAWVVDGNYGPVRERVWRRATHLVWLDYERAVIMARVISRSFLRAGLRTELWAGNRERFTGWDPHGFGTRLFLRTLPFHEGNIIGRSRAGTQ